ncbi:MAG: sigma-70 family RNA polymerase sigma factor [Myxococcales bacterium]|nr:sigma-70 family RNA polymerase sigma factor [Myxococcales bacterium]
MTEDDRRVLVLDALARFEKPLLRYAASLAGREHAADIVQDTFVALCKAERSKVEGHLTQWLFTVCRNRARDVFRQQGRLMNLEDEGMESPDSGPASHVERRQSMSRIEAALASLTDKQRQAVQLKFSAGLRYKEIAEVMDTTVNNVGVLLHAAVQKIRAELGSDFTPALASTRSAK